MKRIDIPSIRQFYQRLNHGRYGLTELVVIDPNTRNGMIATGFFNAETAFVKACVAFNGRCHLYAGRNPRPDWFPKVCENYLDARYKHRAKDTAIEYLTAISLDIDPIRPTGTSATQRQHQMAIQFAKQLGQDLGGWVDDSGNGAYLWLSLSSPIRLTDANRAGIKEQCRQWQHGLVDKYLPAKYGLRIDGCFDLSRVKKVIGTLSVKGTVHRLSQFVVTATPSDRVRNTIMQIPIPRAGVENPRLRPGLGIKTPSPLPPRFLKLLQSHPVIQGLWCTPNENNDTSHHDWKLGCACIDAGLTQPKEMASILMHNPFGKYRRDQRPDYVQTTVYKLVMDIAGIK